MSKQLPAVCYYYDETGAVQTFSMEDRITAFTKENKVKDFAGGDDIPGKKARDIVKDFFLMNFSATDETPADLPDELSKYSKVFDEVKEVVDTHKAAKKEEADKAEKAKDAKRQQKESEDAAKKKEEKEYVKRQGDFEGGLVKQVTTQESMEGKVLKGVIKAIKLPDNVTFNSNGMGIQIGESASVKEISSAFGAIIGAMEGQQALQSSLQFSVGDLLNASISKKIWHSKGQAAEAIKGIMSEKAKKPWDKGVIQFYANMAERIPAEKRMPNVNPSVYLMVSKATPPRIANTDKAEIAKFDTKFTEFRGDLLDRVNSGELVTGNDVKGAISKFKEDNGIIKTSADDVKKAKEKYLLQLFYAVFAKRNLVNNETVTFKKSEDKTEKEMAIPVGTITDLEEEALNNLQNILIKDAEEVLQGFEWIEDAKTKAKKKANYYMEYPFSESAGTTEAPAAEAEQEEAQEEVSV